MTDILDPPRIDPRIAQRWIEARREEGRRRLRLLGGVTSVAVAASLAVGSLWTPLLKVRHVRISVAGPPAGTGSAGDVTVERIRALAGLDHQRLMIDVASGSMAARLDSDPWLGGAVVARHWPGTVTISVGVRSAVAAIPLGSAGGAPGSAGGSRGWAEVDATGRVVTEVSATPYGMPLLLGVGPVPAVGAWVRGSAGPAVAPDALPAAQVDMDAAADGPDVPAGAAAALAFVDSLPAAIRSRVVSVTAGPGAGLALAVNLPRTAVGSLTVHLGDGSQLAAKVTALVTLFDQSDLTGMSTLDLSVPSRPAGVPGHQ